MRFPKKSFKVTIKESSLGEKPVRFMRSFWKRLSGRKAYLSIAVVFVGMLVFFTVMCIADKDREFSPAENRTLATMPELTFESVVDGSFMKEFEAYASDNFIWRDAWVKVAGMTEKLCGRKDNGRVYYGSEGHLFAMAEVDTMQLEKNSSYIISFMEKIKESRPDIEVSVIVAPTATEIQGQYLPHNAPVPDEGAAIDHVGEIFGSVFYDVLPALSEHSGEYVYYRTDHHWTTLGAWYAYRQWAEAYGLGEKKLEDYNVETISTEFYGTNYSKSGIFTPPDMMERFLPENNPKLTMAIGDDVEDLGRKRNISQDIYNAVFLKVRDKYSYFLSGNNALTYIRVDPGNGSSSRTDRRILVIKDSYAHCFVPFMVQDFDEIMAVDLRYYKGDISQLVDRYHITDVMVLYNIIQFSNERNFAYLMQ